jgi:hypothetical protein
MKIIAFFLFVLAPVFSLHAAENHEEQEHDVLMNAKTYFENTFNGVPAEFSKWYSDEYHSSGWILLIKSPEGLAERNKEYATSHGGVLSIDLKVKGQIKGLVSVDALITFNDGEIRENNSCWIYQNDRWKMHTSCLQILANTKDLSDKELEDLKAFEELFK